MARLQILELPTEHHGDDMITPFALVIDQVPSDESKFDTLRRDLGDHEEFVERLGARAALVFEETIEIPANAPSTQTEPLLRVGEPTTADDAERAGITQIVYAHERTRLDLCSALLLDSGTTWRRLVELAAERQRELAGLYRKLDAATKTSQDQRKAALTDALGMDPLRDWDDIYNAAAGLRKERDAQAAALERIRELPETPEVMDAQHPDPTGYLHGYGVAIRAARRTSWNAEKASES